MYQPKTGEACSCKPGIQRDNCPTCEGTGQKVDFKAIRDAGATVAWEHSPLPWFENHNGNIYSAVENGAIFQPARASSDATAEANARFVVRAVNCHADLLAALEGGLDALERIGCQFFACEGPDKPREDMKTCARCAAIQAARAAIAKARRE